MILLLDLGNTRLKWMRLTADGLCPGGSITHRDADFSASLRNAWSALEPPKRIVAASVARSEVHVALDAWAQQQWGTHVEFVTPQAKLAGVTNGYRRPERLGVDRWVALLAAHDRFPGAVSIVDCGSAVTIDALNGAGEHLGGLIAPGLGTMHRSLTGGDINLDAGAGLDAIPAELLGHDTAQAVGHGIHYCLAAFIDRVCDQIDEQLGATSLRLLTGGDAVRMRPLLRGDYRLEPDLVLEGLAVIVRAGQGVNVA